MRVHFDTKKVQKLGRIAFPGHLLRNAGLKEGDDVEIYFDAISKCIIIERAMSIALPDNAAQPPKEIGKGKKHDHQF
ncbi:AbrB/MazE/SpoVT family DNA-binding domain-containing protein [Rhodoferax sp. GW822-FHT02A01]|uniref:AbrB/MazE/SpoVT family DNA-binding domain-containing protein n=1 Tax=Rhodoferax sp. GW822-FHT02A01 TaxID=3141537 RepID=UPI00315D0931